MEKKSIEFKGKNIKYKTIQDLTYKLNITTKQAKELIDNKKVNRIIVSKNGNVEKINVKDQLMLKDFGIKLIKNKKLLTTTKIKIKGNELFNEIYPNTIVHIGIKVHFKFWYSATEGGRRMGTKAEGNRKTPERIFKIKVSDIETKADQLVQFYLNGIDKNIYEGKVEEDVDYEITDIKIRSVYSNQYLTLTEDMKLRDETPLNLLQLYNNIELNISNDCVRNYLTKMLPKISKKIIESLGNINGVS